MSRSFVLAVFALLAVTLDANVASAAVVGPIYPAPGGTSYTSSGSSGGAGGATGSYSGFAAASLAAGNVYWGKSSDVSVSLSLDGPTSTGAELMTFAGITGNIARWSGTTTLHVSNGAGYSLISAPTRLTLTAYNAASAALNFVTPNTLDASFPTAADAVVPVGGNFSVNRLFEVYYGGTWSPAIDRYNNLSTDPSVGTPQTQSSFGGAFYVVPEPATLLALAAAGTLASGRRPRRR